MICINGPDVGAARLTLVGTDEVAGRSRVGWGMRSVLSSLADFLRAGVRPRTPLAKAITLALAIKLVVVVSMKVVWFSGDHRPVIDGSAMGRVIGPGASVRFPPADDPIPRVSEFPAAGRRPGG